MTEFCDLWALWPQTGKRRTQGSKGGKLSPMLYCEKLFNEADANPDAIVKAASKFLKNTDEQYVQGLHIWLRDAKWQLEYDGIKPEPPPVVRASWQAILKDRAGALAMLSAVSEAGCPDDVLDRLANGGIGVTNLNVDRGGLPTAVARTHSVVDLFYKEAAEFFAKAGFNEHIYTKSYVDIAKARRQGCRQKEHMS